MDDLGTALDDLGTALDDLAAERDFSGAVRVDRAGDTVERAYGYAERGLAVPNRTDTQFGIASGCKSFTATTIVALISSGQLALDAQVREVLGDDGGWVGTDVTVGHLLAHTSGIGDYLDESSDIEATDYLMPVPVHTLAETEDYLPLLKEPATKFEPGERFEYCNSGYVLLALVAERRTGRKFRELVKEHVLDPAGMVDSGFLRSDELPGRAARGYLFEDGLRTNLLHLPVRGSGDGGAYSTLLDVHRFWAALRAGRIVPTEWVDRMLRPSSDGPDDWRGYGLGFWLGPADDAAFMEGYDAGVSFRSVSHAGKSLTWTVVSNTTDGAWPVARQLAGLLEDDSSVPTASSAPSTAATKVTQ